ncbi:MAG: ABC transporter ATP-binding protein [Christensenellales bacterium]|jgi:branched-chain amino acid transport system ATP-binding protein
MLEIKDLRAYYGSIEALKGINVSVGAGQIVCLIGSNGAGKSTLLKSISSMIKCTGSIKYEDREMLGKTPRDITSAGILHVPEGRLVFPGLTVRENLEIGTVAWGGVFGKGSFKKELDFVYDLFPRLLERKNQLSWSLSGGEQQMLAIGRAIMGRPKLLMLDEPSMGLAPIVVEELFKTIVDINKTGLPILLVEQNARLALEVSHHAYVIEQGRIVTGGAPEDLRNDPAVLEAYLGKLASM